MTILLPVASNKSRDIFNACLQVSRLHEQPAITAFSLCLFGFFALPQLPVCFELGVEVTYPVPEAISLGLLWSAS